MLANDLVLDNSSGTDITYRLVNNDQSGSRRIDIATDLRSPSLLNIRHSETGKGSSAVDRHLVQFIKTVQSSSGPVLLTVNCTVAVPRAAEVTPTMVKDILMNMMDFLSDGALSTLATSANIDALLRGES